MESNLYPTNAILFLLAFEIIKNGPINKKCEHNYTEQLLL